MCRGGDHGDHSLNHKDLEKLHWFGLFQVYADVTKSVMQCIVFQLAQRSYLPDYSESPCPRNTWPEQTGQTQEGWWPQGVKDGCLQCHKAQKRQSWVAGSPPLPSSLTFCPLESSVRYLINSFGKDSLPHALCWASVTSRWAACFCVQKPCACGLLIVLLAGF